MSLRRTALYALAAAAMIALPGCGISTASSDEVDGPQAIRQGVGVVDGLPQDGITLGQLDAPATLTVYAAVDDVGAGFVKVELPQLIRELVKPGKLRIQLRTVTGDAATSGGQASIRAARVAQAVGLQDKLWQFYAALATLSTGSADEPLLRKALTYTPGIDEAQVMRDARGERVAKAVDKAQRFATEAGVDAFPTFVLSRSDGGAARRVAWNCSGCLSGAVHKQLKSLR